jgi:hypothetical protein
VQNAGNPRAVALGVAVVAKPGAPLATRRAIFSHSMPRGSRPQAQVCAHHRLIQLLSREGSVAERIIGHLRWVAIHLSISGSILSFYKRE